LKCDRDTQAGTRDPPFMHIDIDVTSQQDSPRQSVSLWGKSSGKLYWDIRRMLVDDLCRAVVNNSPRRTFSPCCRCGRKLISLSLSLSLSLSSFFPRAHILLLKALHWHGILRSSSRLFLPSPPKKWASPISPKFAEIGLSQGWNSRRFFLTDTTYCIGPEGIALDGKRK
jgi:hypothetical protein